MYWTWLFQSHVLQQTSFEGRISGCRHLGWTRCHVTNRCIQMVGWSGEAELVGYVIVWEWPSREEETGTHGGGIFCFLVTRKSLFDPRLFDIYNLTYINKYINNWRIICQKNCAIGPLAHLPPDVSVDPQLVGSHLGSFHPKERTRTEF